MVNREAEPPNPRYQADPGNEITEAEPRFDSDAKFQFINRKFNLYF